MNPNQDQEKKDATLRKELRQRMVGYIVGALGLVAGLAWNDAIKGAIEHVYKIESAGILIKFLYALAITIFIVIISYYVMKITDVEKK
jgi:hypothetical protein